MARWEICWRATEHGWEGSAFRSKCGEAECTLTIVKVIKDKKNFVFGGYATAPWRPEYEDVLGKLLIYYSCMFNFLPVLDSLIKVCLYTTKWIAIVNDDIGKFG